MTPLDHLIAAMVSLEEQLQEIEHRQSFIRSAIEAFGVDADDALLVAVHTDDDRKADEMLVELARDRADRLTIVPVPQPASEDLAVGYKLPNSNQWDWPLVAAEIRTADDLCARRARHLQDTIGVSPATAQWMVKRCRELSLIDAAFDQQAARDRAAAAL